MRCIFGILLISLVGISFQCAPGMVAPKKGECADGKLCIDCTNPNEKCLPCRVGDTSCASDQMKALNCKTGQKCSLACDKGMACKACAGTKTCKTDDMSTAPTEECPIGQSCL